MDDSILSNVRYPFDHNVAYITAATLIDNAATLVLEFGDPRRRSA